MNRRQFLGGVTAASVVTPFSGFSAADVRVAGKRLPDWALKQIDEGLVRFRAWKGNDEVVSFPMMTDCHSRYYL